MSFVNPGTKLSSQDFLSATISSTKTLQHGDPGYKSGLEKLEKTFVVNDVAERGVKFIQDYSNILTKDETEKQFVC